LPQCPHRDSLLSGSALSPATKNYLEGWWGVADENHLSCPNSQDVGTTGIDNGWDFVFYFRPDSDYLGETDRVEGMEIRSKVLDAHERDGLITLRRALDPTEEIKLRIRPPDKLEEILDMRAPSAPSQVILFQCSR
jgi:hypothetical protein